MPLYDLAIAVRDEADLPSGHKRKKEGDVIACRLHSETQKIGGWGTSEILNHLILTVDMTAEQANEITLPQYEDESLEQIMDFYGGMPVWEPGNTHFNTELDMGGGSKQTKIDRIVENDHIFEAQSTGGCLSAAEKPDFSRADVGDTVEEKDITWKCVGKADILSHAAGKVFAVGDRLRKDGWYYRCSRAGTIDINAPAYPQKYGEKIIDGTVELICIGKKDAKVTGKRRFSIPLQTLKDGWLPEMDIAKVRDCGIAYQPFAEKALAANDLSVAIIDAKEEVSLIKDNLNSEFLFPTQKITAESRE